MRYRDVSRGIWGPRRSEAGVQRAKDRSVESWGTDVLAGDEDKKVASRPDRSARVAKTGTRKASRHSSRDANVGDALRSVYQQTVNEDVPPEFLDLLGKLT